MVQNFGALVQGINTKFVDLENRLGNPMVSAALNEKEILHNQNVIWKEMEKIHKLVLSERNFPSSSVPAVEEGKNAEIHTQTSCGGTLFPSRNAKGDGQIGNHTRRGGKETFFEHARFPQHMDEHQPSIPHSVTRERSIPTSNRPSSFVGHDDSIHSKDKKFVLPLNPLPSGGMNLNLGGIWALDEISCLTENENVQNVCSIMPVNTQTPRAGSWLLT